VERRRIKRKQLLDDLKERRGYWKLKDEALARSLWRNGFGRVSGLVVRRTADWMNIGRCRLVPQSPDAFSLSTQFRRAQLGHFSFVVAPNNVITIDVVRSWIDVVFLFGLISSCLITSVGKCSVLRCFAQERNRNAKNVSARHLAGSCSWPYRQQG
jgi:hypothetical protein